MYLQSYRTYKASKSASTVAKPIIQLNDIVKTALENDNYTPKRNPGINKVKCVTLPDFVLKAIHTVIRDNSIKNLWIDGQKLNRYLKARHIPESCLNKDGNTPASNVYHWKAIDYNKYRSYTYLLGRAAQEYSTVFRVLSEISQRNSQFKPKTFFDFGAGVGTGTWAASSLWKKSIFEYYLVDLSRHMNDISELILREGDENKEMTLKSVHYRQFNPASVNTKFDLVLCAYSLFELHDKKARTEVLLNLWNKCNDYLVIIENGTNAGFNLINEARDLLVKNENASIFSPCPHELKCPRVAENDGTPCNFMSTYIPLPYSNDTEAKHELFSYIVLQKGQQKDMLNENENWPRIIRPTLVRTRHTICRLCTKNGKLEEMIFTRSKHSGFLYQCAKSSSWGDRMPIETIEKKS